MERSTIGAYLGWLAAISAILIMLAGSDWPPPIGFLLVVVAAGVLGVLVRLWIPRTLSRSDHVSTARVVGQAAVPGALAGLVAAGMFMVVGRGEPQVGPGAMDFVIFAIVAVVVFAIAAMGLQVLALLLDRGLS